ncbi:MULTISPECIES: SAF domain-containing protein [Thermoanaerobacter]|jgi:pilus assembly protein CpaB|uniref:SAF domain n=2 Tax=Thermoanaerobacter TaxID=1754 RepID=B0KAW5_THEP3|nr:MULTISPECIES: SAF domain-containing protein [Thermoanaerobacter]ABY93736.1 SAF domain [Thermoanaerobacter pseudethanolicus ATCC 33223]ADV78698.1 SAF domain protein [Thermoanaerobacter brockii subsp. finnii Ako-1]HBW59375.1 flagellar biosynthesis protein FlgA [Thermoanaerobacter sp.]
MSRIIKIALITAVVFAAFMFVFMQNIQKTEKVVVVEKDIPAGTVISQDAVKVTDVPASVVRPNYAKSLADVIGKVVKEGRVQGDFIPVEILTSQDEKLLEAGHVIMTIQIDKVEAKTLQSGDTVSFIVFDQTGSKVLEGFKVISVFSDSDKANLILNADLNAASELAPYIKLNSFKIVRR